MILTRIAAIALLGIVLVSPAGCSSEPATEISQIVFTTSAQEIEAGIVSSRMTINTQDANGEPCRVKDDTIISLFTSCSTGHFENGNTTITSVTIPRDGSFASFYYMDTAAGSPTIVAGESPSQGWTSATQQETIYWVGTNGERRIENVYYEGTEITGADGHYIELVNNPKAVNPSWSTLEAFLRSDETEKITYNYSTFVCADFAERLHNEAENAHIITAFVIIDFGSGLFSHLNSLGSIEDGCLPNYWGGGHACNAFQTTDRGLIFIDDTGSTTGHGVDCTVNVSKGQKYIPRSMFTEYIFEYCPMGDVSNFSVVW